MVAASLSTGSLLGLCLLLVSCEGSAAGATGSRGATVSGGVTRIQGAVDDRTGPPFAEAFPDSRVLLTTPEVEETRIRLAEAQLPDTQGHHDELVALLASVEKISPGHLQLLVEAVHLPSRGSSIQIDGRSQFYAQRGQGRFASVADRLLLAGAEKLDGVDATAAGRLMGRTQENDALASLAKTLLPVVDDGSDRALKEMLAGFHGSPALRPFLADVLVPSGRLDGLPHWVVLGILTNDADRVALLRAYAPRMKSCVSADLQRYIDCMSFDAGKVATVAAVGPCIESATGADLAAVLRLLSFDNGRADAADKLAKTAKLTTSHADLGAILGTCSFDAGRVRVVRSLAPSLSDAADRSSAKAILAAFSFDSGRLDAVKALVSTLGAMPADDQRSALEAFSFASGRDSAARVLAR